MNTSIYPLYLPQTDCFDSMWINLAYVMYCDYDEEKEEYFIKFLSSSINPCPHKWVEIIENEFRLIETNLKHSPDETE